MSNITAYNQPTSVYNAFIFNWIENYNEKLKNLKTTLTELNNKVIVFDKLKSEELFEVVNKIRYSNFDVYNYIVIIILDNKSTSGRFIVTADDIEVLLTTEILTVIQCNETLRDKPRLFVIQKLLDNKNFRQEGAAANVLKVAERQQLVKSNSEKILQKGLTIEMTALEYSGNFKASPFIDTFCNDFKNNATTMPIDQIYSNILDEIKTNKKYKIVIEFGTNQTKSSNLIFGTALSAEELRDVFHNHIYNNFNNFTESNMKF